MSDNTPRPDRADHNDPDIPAYDATSSGGSTPASGRPAAKPTPDRTQPSSPYERAGRAAPQEIPATGPRDTAAAQPAPTAQPAQPEQPTPAPAPGPGPDLDNRTAAFPAQNSGAPGSTPASELRDPVGRDPAPARGDYRDEDFGPAGAAPPTPRSAEPETAYVPAAPAAAAPAAAPVAEPAAAPTPTTPTAQSATPNAQPTVVAPGGDGVVDKRSGRRGTIDLGLLIARLLLGIWLVLESIGTFFQLGGSEGLAGLEAEYAAYPLGEILAIAVPTMQLAAGVFLVVGLVTPVAAAVATVVTGFVALHELAADGAGLNVFAWPEAVWLSIVLVGLSIVLQFTGPGYYSLDNGRSWARRPLASSWIFIVVALLALGALWWFGTEINPFA